MPVSFKDTLVVGISSTALFDLRKSDEIFQKARKKLGNDVAIRKYRKHMFNTENDALNAGTGMPVVKALLELNEHGNDNDSPLVQVVVMSKNSPETGVRILKNIRDFDLNIPRTVFTGGETVTDYLSAYDVDLFLTTDVQDGQRVADSRQCAVAILKEPPSSDKEEILDKVRIAFDGDAVLFDEESELVYKAKGLDKFLEHERVHENDPMHEGPYAAFLKKLSRLQDRLPHQMELSPIRIAIVTARNSPADIRVIKTLRHWGVYADAAFFMGGLEKTEVLKAFRPHIFFDDQDVHLKKASSIVPSGQVPYPSDSPLAKKKSKVKKKGKRKK